MQEWLNWHAWKACEPLKGSAGSNPALSANNTDNKQITKQTPNFTPANVRLGVFLSGTCSTVRSGSTSLIIPSLITFLK
jgi:hypothetical protein